MGSGALNEGVLAVLAFIALTKFPFCERVECRSSALNVAHGNLVRPVLDEVVRTVRTIRGRTASAPHDGLAVD